MAVGRPFTRLAAGEGEPGLGWLVGQRLAVVKYRYLAAADGSRYAPLPGRVDVHLTAVKLGFEHEALRTVTWAMDGPLEGLAVLDDGGAYAGMLDKEVDVTGADGWRELAGRRVLSVAAAWHVSGEDCPESLWSLRLVFSSGSVVIALGTWDDELDYMPDELVVIWDEALARAFHPHHSPDSAWGRPAAGAADESADMS